MKLYLQKNAVEAVFYPINNIISSPAPIRIISKNFQPTINECLDLLQTVKNRNGTQFKIFIEEKMPCTDVQLQRITINTLCLYKSMDG